MRMYDYGFVCLLLSFLLICLLTLIYKQLIQSASFIFASDQPEGIMSGMAFFMCACI
jgi:hypothetical protein